MPVIGFLYPSSADGFSERLRRFREGLKESGYVEGHNVAIEYRWGDDQIDRLPTLAADLVRRQVALIAAASASAVFAAKAASSTIPVAFVIAEDPVRLGLVASLARPGGNVTGLSYFNAEITGKRLELMKELVPGLTRVAVLRNPTIASHAVFWQETEVAAGKLGITLRSVEVRRPEDFEAAFAAATRDKAQALLAFDDPLTIAYRPRIVALAASSHLPALYGFREFPDDGGLMSYGPSFVVLFRRAAAFVDKILKGAKPADLPVEQPTKFELVINLKSAKALGITVQPSLLARADAIIE